MPSPDQQARFAAAYSTLKTIAVTGTNGKTTTVSMIAAIVAASGETEAKLTTLGSFIAGKKFAAGDPASEFLHTVEAAAAMGVKTFALEVTSKALRSGWAQKWPAHIAVFTNLSRDHLDMHLSAEAYFAAKAQLFLSVADQGQCVLNAADSNAALLAEAIAGDTPIHCYASRPSEELLALGATGVQSSRAGLTIALAATGVQSSRAGLTIALADSALARALGGELRLAVVGKVHADNALAAALAAHLAGYSASAIVAGLENFAGVPGRFQIVGSEPLTVVDYAHTPDGLRGTLECARGLVAAGASLWLIFGCGGERDQGKRSEMGRIAHALADEVTITNDNPRREDPKAIAMHIEAGVQGAGARWRTCLDREQAVREVIAGARAQDVIVIAGKGHEDTQEVQGEFLSMCDLDLARAALQDRA